MYYNFISCVERYIVKYILFFIISTFIILSFFIPNIWMISTTIIAIIAIEKYFSTKSEKLISSKSN